VVLVAAAVEDRALHAGLLRAARQQLAGAAGLVGGLQRAKLVLGPAHGGERAAALVVDELGEDAAVGAEHGDARARRGAAHLGAHAAAALEPRLGPGLDGHARLPTFLATYSPS
jgi:hypothetical protein